MNDPTLVEGGQGRTGAEVTATATQLAVLAILAAMFLAVVAAATT